MKTKNIALNASLTLVVLVLTCYRACSQQSTKAGINFTTEVISNSNFRLGAGLSLERQATKHSGIETGLYYRNIQRDLLAYINTRNYNLRVAERYLSVPLLYKFHSRFLNVSLGPTFDIYLGWKQKYVSNSTAMENYTVDPQTMFGALLKVSKNINLGANLCFEPEVRFNPVFTTGSYFLGFGFAFKYRI
jgi:hypothetical protein